MKMSGSFTLQALAVFAAALLSGCKVGPDFHPPRANMPPAYAGTGSTGVNASVTAPDAGALAAWWQTFNDPTLSELVDQAMMANLDLKIAEARLREARGTRGVVAGGLWPAVGASASYERTRMPASAVAPAQSAHDLFLAGLDAVWELDLFGGRRRNVESATANVEAAEEGIHGVLVSIIAETALDYIQLRGIQQQIVIAQENLKAQQRTADITRQRFSAGFVGALDVANANAQVATTQSQIPVLETSARQLIYALSVLVARAPGDLVNELAGAGAIPIAPPEVPAGVPSELLRRRPDIRQAEAQLHAATAQIGVAIADLFPKFSFTGSLTYQNNLLQDWFTNPARGFSFGPSVTWPILQGGAIRSNIRAQKASRDQSYFSYQKTVLTAVQEVENALVAFGKEHEHRSALEDAVTANRKAVNLATQLYSQGETDFLNVLNAQRSLYASEDALVQSTRSLATDVAALYKALGGGWQDQNETRTAQR
jgi:NodT family efflux transporter outer membrane factor (OMF) lipoprotein